MNGDAPVSIHHIQAKELLSNSKSNLALIVNELRMRPNQASGEITATLALAQAVQSVAASLIHVNEERQA